MFPIETVLPTVFIFHVSSTKYYVGIFIFASWIFDATWYVLEMACFK